MFSFESWLGITANVEALAFVAEFEKRQHTTNAE